MSDEKLGFDYQFTRTMSIVKELHLGKKLKLSDGYTIAMGEDMSIGYVFTDQADGKETIGGMSSMDLRQLNELLEKYGIGLSIGFRRKGA